MPTRELSDVVAEMRRLGVERVVFHEDGSVGEVVIGGPSPVGDDPTPPPSKEHISEGERRVREAARIRNLALHGLGGTK